MTRKSRKTIKKRKIQGKHTRRIKIKKHANRRIRIRRARGSSRKPKRIKLKRIKTLSPRELNAQARALHVLGVMRRGHATLTKAAREEKIKPETVLRYVRKALYRSGPGKPWRARASDQISALMNVLTSQGRDSIVVKDSRERRLLARYEWALRRFRAGEVGAEAALRKFKGKVIGGLPLITDTNQLIQLEEAGQLDFENLYTTFGPQS
jgi:hypothetical protein